MDREDAGSNGGIDVYRSQHAYIHVSLFFSHLPLFFEAVEAKFIVPFVSRKKQHAFIDPSGNIYGRLITLGPFVPRHARARAPQQIRTTRGRLFSLGCQHRGRFSPHVRHATRREN